MSFPSVYTRFQDTHLLSHAWTMACNSIACQIIGRLSRRRRYFCFLWMKVISTDSCLFLRSLSFWHLCQAFIATFFLPILVIIIIGIIIYIVIVTKLITTIIISGRLRYSVWNTGWVFQNFHLFRASLLQALRQNDIQASLYRRHNEWYGVPFRSQLFKCWIVLACRSTTIHWISINKAYWVTQWTVIYPVGSARTWFSAVWLDFYSNVVSGGYYVMYT